MTRKKSGNFNTPWSDDELRRSIEVYVLLLRFQLLSQDDRVEPVAQAMLSDVLALRNDAAIRYRMRNISAVVQELGAPFLSDFSPAESVGRHVRGKIRAMLLEDEGFVRMLRPNGDGDADAKAKALYAVRILRNHIEDLERQLAWRGHNGPPDQKDCSPERIQLRSALDDIGSIERELEKSSPDKAVVKSQVTRILGLFTVFAGWVGARTTKFVDAALVASAPIVVAKVTGILPALVNAVEAVFKFISH